MIRIDPAKARKMVARRPGPCAACKSRVNAGDWIYWSGDLQAAAHVECLEQPSQAAPSASDQLPGALQSTALETLKEALRTGHPTFLWAKAVELKQKSPVLFSQKMGTPRPEQAGMTLPDGIVGSPEQEAIWDALANSSDHVVVKALAGTGKSFTCRVGMKVLPVSTRILYLAFNKEIVREFEQGAPANAKVKTLNAIGFNVVTQAFPKVLVDDNKVRNIISELVPSYTLPADEYRTMVQVVERVVALAQGYLLDGKDAQALIEVATRHEVDLEDNLTAVTNLVPQVLEICKERTGVVSYNDQLWLPVVLNLPCPKFDVIFVDEAQDLNKVQHALVLKLLAPGGRVVVVGDDHQAIYGFRGSDVDSIANFCKLLKQTQKPIRQLPLTVTRRCPKSVVKYAQSYVPSIEALPDAKEGQVVPTTEPQADRMLAIGDMVVCRVNAPLLSVAFRLVRRGVKAVVRGRDIGQGLISLVQKLQASDINDLLIKVDAWAAKEIQKVAGTSREETAVQTITDRAECVRVLAEDADSVTDLCARIANIFEGKDNSIRNAVVLSSIHRAKGLEAERVFWLHPEIECKSSQPWQQVQEVNLRYVAVTRAKSELFLVKASK